MAKDSLEGLDLLLETVFEQFELFCQRHCLKNELMIRLRKVAFEYSLKTRQIGIRMGGGGYFSTDPVFGFPASPVCSGSTHYAE